MNDISQAPTIVTTIRIPADLLARLKARAAADDRSLASLIVHYSRQGLDTVDKEKENRK